MRRSAPHNLNTKVVPVYDATHAATKHKHLKSKIGVVFNGKKVLEGTPPRHLAQKKS